MADLGTIARPYARAAFRVASESGALDAWSKALASAANIVTHDEAARALSSPKLTDDQRVELITSIAASMASGELFGTREFKELLKVLTENDRLAALPAISERFDELKSEAENRVDVTLVSATAVEPDIAQKITEALERRLGRKVDLKVEIDENLIGGAVIRAEDMVIDGSVRTRLQRLTETLVR